MATDVEGIVAFFCIELSRPYYVSYGLYSTIASDLLLCTIAVPWQQVYHPPTFPDFLYHKVPNSISRHALLTHSPLLSLQMDNTMTASTLMKILWTVKRIKSRFLHRQKILLNMKHHSSFWTTTWQCLNRQQENQDIWISFIEQLRWQ